MNFESILIALAQFAHWEVEVKYRYSQIFQAFQVDQTVSRKYLKKNLTLDTNWLETPSFIHELLFGKGKEFRIFQKFFPWDPRKDKKPKFVVVKRWCSFVIDQLVPNLIR